MGENNSAVPLEMVLQLWLVDCLLDCYRHLACRQLSLPQLTQRTFQS
jgi:hypothetical protein